MSCRDGRHLDEVAHVGSGEAARWRVCTRCATPMTRSPIRSRSVIAFQAGPATGGARGLVDRGVMAPGSCSSILRLNLGRVLFRSRGSPETPCGKSWSAGPGRLKVASRAIRQSLQGHTHEFALRCPLGLEARGAGACFLLAIRFSRPPVQVRVSRAWLIFVPLRFVTLESNCKPKPSL